MVADGRTARRRLLSSAAGGPPVLELVRSVRMRDPAARSVLEVLLAYPGVHAIALHRLAHALDGAGLRLLARLVAHASRFLTGIEIHPGASIGRRVFIDHGMGTVIGQTAVVGDDCTLYQGVTLGGTGKQQGKRHPTLGRGCVVGAGAKVLGDIRLGDNVMVGAGSVVIRDVPDHGTVVGIPARLVGRDTRAHAELLDHADLIDPIMEKIQALQDEIRRAAGTIRRRGTETSSEG
jgi:serine O-acetyltransferase